MVMILRFGQYCGRKQDREYDKPYARISNMAYTIAGKRQKQDGENSWPYLNIQLI